MKQLIAKILKSEGPASIVTNDVDGPYVTATWNSYITLNQNGDLLIPAGGYHQTEKNIQSGSKVIMLIGSKEVEGLESAGAGLRLTGSVVFYDSGEQYELVNRKFPWSRAVMLFTIENIEQLQ